MSFLRSLDIAGSGLTASRLRMDIISENMANVETTRTENGGPYRRKMVVYRPINGSSFHQMLDGKLQQVRNAGVQVTQIVEDPSEFTPVYNPEHPDANEDGYVLMPNVNPVKETLDMMAATRSYDLNVTAVNAIKTMASKALEIGR